MKDNRGQATEKSLDNNSNDWEVACPKLESAEKLANKIKMKLDLATPIFNSPLCGFHKVQHTEI